MGSGWFSSVSGGVPCLRRSRALLSRARNNRCYSDPISAPAQIKLRAAASRFSMALRGETASSLTACPPSPDRPSPGLFSRRGRRETSCCEPLGTDAARLPPFALQIHLKESDERFRCTQAGVSVPYLGGKPRIISPVGHCHLGPRLSCRHVRLETLFRRAGFVCVISILAIAPSLRSGGAAYYLCALHTQTHTHTHTRRERGGEHRHT